MNKIGTLTFHEAINYGAVLQAYALQRAIEKIGYDSEVINYSCPAIAERYTEKPTSPKACLRSLLSSASRNRRTRAFRAFLQRYIDLSEYVSHDDLASFCERYRLVIVGSDQVWNPDLTSDDEAYFLGYIAPNKRASYAASMGKTSWDSDLESKVVPILRDYHFLTVREDSAANYLESLLGFKPAVVCDPVFLLTRGDWDSITVDPQIAGKYILLFSFGRPPKDCLSWSKHQARLLGCRLVVLHFGTLPIPGVVNVRDAGPSEFLGWIRGAELVITSSFHACSLSIIFERDFCWFRSISDSEELKSRSSRIEDLLTRFGLEDRAVRAESVLPTSIEYEPICEEIARYRSSSLSVLREVVS